MGRGAQGDQSGDGAHPTNGEAGTLVGQDDDEADDEGADSKGQVEEH